MRVCVTRSMAAVESSSSPSLWWWPLPPWLSPGAAWFVLFTVVVGAVAVSSRAHEQAPPPPPSSTRRRLTRSASSMVMERLRSFSAFSFVHAISGVQEDDITVGPPTSPAASGNAEAAEENPIGLDEAHAHPAVAAVRPPPPQAAAAAAATAGEVAAAATAEERPRKRREAAKGRRAFAEVEGKAEVNARAERFIRQFREDLRLQRLMSVLNRTHALAGAASSSAP